MGVICHSGVCHFCGAGRSRSITTKQVDGNKFACDRCYDAERAKIDRLPEGVHAPPIGVLDFYTKGHGVILLPEGCDFCGRSRNAYFNARPVGGMFACDSCYTVEIENYLKKQKEQERTVCDFCSETDCIARPIDRNGKPPFACDRCYRNYRKTSRNGVERHPRSRRPERPHANHILECDICRFAANGLQYIKGPSGRLGICQNCYTLLSPVVPPDVERFIDRLLVDVPRPVESDSHISEEVRILDPVRSSYRKAVFLEPPNLVPERPKFLFGPVRDIMGKLVRGNMEEKLRISKNVSVGAYVAALLFLCAVGALFSPSGAFVGIAVWAASALVVHRHYVQMATRARLDAVKEVMDS